MIGDVIGVIIGGTLIILGVFAGLGALSHNLIPLAISALGDVVVGTILVGAAVNHSVQQAKAPET